MKKLLLLLLLLPFFTQSQQSEWNLKNLNALNVQIRDSKNLLTYDNLLKVETETKLKLKSVGIRLDEKAATLIIGITEVCNPKYLIWLRVFEDVNLKRNETNQMAFALTYSQTEFVSPKIFEHESTAIIKTIDKLLNLFLSEYLEENK